MTGTVIPLPPREWKPTADQKRAIRAYCARVEGKRPMQVVICPGWRVNKADDTRPACLNLLRLSDRADWGDTDLHDVGAWSDLDQGVRLDRKGRALIDLYIYGRDATADRGDLLGNAQVYVDQIDGQTRITGFAATCHPYEQANV
ncbi:hypothetical protein LCM08_06285 [Salipiger pacificus]|nr:hypothetical protein [Alloyangia pacifica]